MKATRAGSIGTLALLASGALVTGMVTSGSAVAAPAGGSQAAVTGLLSQGMTTQTHFQQLNNSGVRGRATVTVRHRRLTIDINARGVLKDMPHAMHIHFSADSSHTCPTVQNDTNADHRLSTSEGAPAYGGVQVSLTTRGAHGPGSALAVNRFPTASNGRISYERTIHVRRGVARAIRNGEAAVVIHGVDYNQNGKYDFDAGKSDLDPNLPAEATDPVACGILHVQKSGLQLP